MKITGWGIVLMMMMMMMMMAMMMMTTIGVIGRISSD